MEHNVNLRPPAVDRPAQDDAHIVRLFNNAPEVSDLQQLTFIAL